MRYAICIICTSLLIVGCKPTERTAQESRARFEAKTTTATEKAAPPVSPGERASIEGTFEKRLTDLSTKTNALDSKIQALVEPSRATINTTSANLKVKIEGSKKELAAAKSLTESEWNNTRGKLERDIADLERELDTLTKQIG